MDYYAIGRCTPGVIAVNTATFVGQGLAGPIGGIVATPGSCIPVPDHHHGHRSVYPELRTPCDRPERFRGDPCLCLRPDLQCGRKALEKAVVDKPTLVICVLVILGSALTDLSPIVFVILRRLLELS